MRRPNVRIREVKGSPGVWVAHRGKADVPFVSFLATEIAAKLSRASARFYMTALRHIVNDEAFLAADGTPRFAIDCETARRAIEAMLRRMGAVVIDIAERRGGVRVRHTEKHEKVSLILCALEKVMMVLLRAGILKGQNPLKIDGWDDLTPAQKAVIQALSKQGRPDKASEHRRDTGRFYRMPFKRWTPVRTNDVRWSERVRERLAGTVPESVLACVLLIIEGGPRGGEPPVATMWGWWKGSKFGRKVRIRSKGHGEGEVKDVTITATLWAMIVRMVDGWRKVRDGLSRGMDHFRRLGRLADKGDKAAEAELRAARLFLNPRGRPLTYDLLRYYFNARVRREGEDTVTLHWLRHEKVFRRLREIDAMDVSPRERRRLRLHFVRKVMMWASERMLLCYDAYEDARLAGEEEEASIDLLEKRVACAVGARTPAAPAIVGAMPAALAGFLR